MLQQENFEFIDGPWDGKIVNMAGIDELPFWYIVTDTDGRRWKYGRAGNFTGDPETYRLMGEA